MQGVLMDGIMSMPLGWQAWVFWMMIVNSASLFFLKHMEARFCLAVWIPNGITMMLFAERFGFVRFLGISHIIWWTPLIIYLFLRRKQFDLKTLAGKWVVVMLITNSVSLAIDYVDVVRYMAGDREDQRPGATEQLEEPEMAYHALPKIALAEGERVRAVGPVVIELRHEKKA